MWNAQVRPYKEWFVRGHNLRDDGENEYDIENLYTDDNIVFGGYGPIRLDQSQGGTAIRVVSSTDKLQYANETNREHSIYLSVFASTLKPVDNGDVYYTLIGEAAWNINMSFKNGVPSNGIIPPGTFLCDYVLPALTFDFPYIAVSVNYNETPLIDYIDIFPYYLSAPRK